MEKATSIGQRVSDHGYHGCLYVDCWMRSACISCVDVTEQQVLLDTDIDVGGDSLNELKPVRCLANTLGKSAGLETRVWSTEL